MKPLLYTESICVYCHASHTACVCDHDGSSTFHYPLLVGLEHHHTHNAPHSHTQSVHTEDALAAINAPDFDAAGENHVIQSIETTIVSATEEEENNGQEKLQTLMGMSLLLGFIFMLFVDQVSGGHSHAPSSGIYIHW